MSWRVWDKNKYPSLPTEDADIAKYRIICRKFHEKLSYIDYDEKSLTYYVKELFENGKLYVSVEAEKLHKDPKNGPIMKDQNKIAQLNDILDNKKYTQLNTTNFPYGSQQYVIWEHVVPTSLIIKYALDLYKNGNFSLPIYKDIKDMCGMVCLVTKGEDKKLSAKGFRNSFPNNPYTTTGQEFMIIGDIVFNNYDAWARYKDENGEFDIQPIPYP
ncbi:MAG: hypothetical protein KBT06_06155 [Prevotellaceae bacterium]|nr:hypothetical protein [Candidatus Colivivens equi]